MPDPSELLNRQQIISVKFNISTSFPTFGCLPTESVPFKYSSEKLVGSLLVQPVLHRTTQNFTLFCNQYLNSDQIQSMVPGYRYSMQKSLSLRDLIHHLTVETEDHAIAGFGYQSPLNKQQLTELKNLASQLAIVEVPGNFQSNRFAPQEKIEHALPVCPYKINEEIFFQEKTGKITRHVLDNGQRRINTPGEDRNYLSENERTFSAWCCFSNAISYEETPREGYRKVLIDTFSLDLKQASIENISEIIESILERVAGIHDLKTFDNLIVTTPFAIIASSLGRELRRQTGNNSLKIFAPDVFIWRGWAPCLSFIQAILSNMGKMISINLENFPCVHICIIQ